MQNYQRMKAEGKLPQTTLMSPEATGEDPMLKDTRVKEDEKE